MEHDDDIKKWIELDDDSPPEQEGAATTRTKKIVRAAKRRQSQSDLLDFGLLKLWTIFLEFLAKLHTTSKYNKTMIKTNYGVKK